LGTSEAEEGTNGNGSGFTSIQAKRSAMLTISRLFANLHLADEWFKEHDPEGVVFEYPVIE
jgi:hypothetical protein